VLSLVVVSSLIVVIKFVVENSLVFGCLALQLVSKIYNIPKRKYKYLESIFMRTTPLYFDLNLND
jgi:hypothetical protein